MAGPVLSHDHCRQHDIDVYGNCPGPDPRGKFKDFFREKIPDFFTDTIPEWTKKKYGSLVETLKHWSIRTSVKATKWTMHTVAPLTYFAEPESRKKMKDRGTSAAAALGAKLAGLFAAVQGKVSLLVHGSGPAGALTPDQRVQLQESINRSPYQGSVSVEGGTITDETVSIGMRLTNDLYATPPQGIRMRITLYRDYIRCAFYPENPLDLGIAHEIQLRHGMPWYEIRDTMGRLVPDTALDDPVLGPLLENQLDVCDQILRSLIYVSLIP